jgi:hypothetical protein
MPEFQSTPKTSPTEWLLARLTTPTRAAAILGDLHELSTTRGRLWFWTTYTRTLISLGWRTPVALAGAYAWSRSSWVFIATHSSMHWLFRWVRVAQPMNHMPLGIRLQPMIVPLQGLHFLLPFVLIRFGPRDRVTRLAAALFLISLPLFSRRLGVLMPVEALTAIIATLALCSSEWRRPMIVLAAALLPRYAFVEWNVVFLFTHPTLFRHDYMALYLLQLAAGPVICSLLHPWMLERPEVSGPLELAGGTNV